MNVLSILMSMTLNSTKFCIGLPSGDTVRLGGRVRALFGYLTAMVIWWWQI
jgi:hypothetical protein